MLGLMFNVICCSLTQGFAGVQVLVPFVNCLMILDSTGERIMAKYYDERPKAEQDKYEALLHKKTKTLSFRSDGKLCFRTILACVMFEYM